MSAPAIDPEQPSAATAVIADTFNDFDSIRSTLKGDDELKDADGSSLEEAQVQAATEETTPSTQLVCYGKYGKTVLWMGVALMWIVFELDHTTLYNYQNYAASEFNQISSLGALTTAGTIIIAIMKPPIAKISDVVGRVETYCAIVALYVISYIVCATAPNFSQYAGGYVIYAIGATGMQILNQIIVADITTSRCRGLANGLISLPFMIIPWLSAFIVDGALSTIGWRWGIGMFAIIMPVTSLGIIGPLLYFRHRGKKEGQSLRRPTTPKTFVAAIDLIGITLLAVGCAMFLLPMALAGNMVGGWSAPWVPAVMVVGIVFLAIFGVYETRFATNPVMPAKYFKSLSLVLACTIGLLDAFAFQVTHTYMYAWSTVVHDFSARNATFLTYTSGCFQVLSGLLTGFLMYRTRRYKWLLIIGTVIRLIGYGAMMRLRGSTNPVFELFIVQAIQGLGSGTVGTVVIVVAQIVVASAELGQATALILLAIFMGQAVGSAVAGGIYTNLFKPRLRTYLGAGATQTLIDAVFDSITSTLPRMGSSEREAINNAYSDVLRYMTIAALVASAVPFLTVWFLPNLQLSDKHSLSEEEEEKDKATKNTSDPNSNASEQSDVDNSDNFKSRRSTLTESVFGVKSWWPSKSGREKRIKDDVTVASVRSSVSSAETMTASPAQPCGSRMTT